MHEDLCPFHVHYFLRSKRFNYVKAALVSSSTRYVFRRFFGLILSPSAFALVPKEIAFGIAPWVALAGNLFLALIKMVIIPLVMIS